MEADIWHELKTDPEVFDDVASGAKTHEIRRNDRNFQVGDGLLLRKTRYTGAQMHIGRPLEYTGDECRRVVSHILSGYGLNDHWVILSFAQLPASAPSVSVDEDAELVTAEMLRAAQLKSELGAYATSNLSGAYDLISELYYVMRAEAGRAEPQSIAHTLGGFEGSFFALNGRKPTNREIWDAARIAYVDSYGKGPKHLPWPETPTDPAKSAEHARDVPEGWKLVPTAPTDEMIYMMYRAFNNLTEKRDSYAHMLAAAPEPKP